jgi:6-pyruvoyltetrahydropterin/6-carboxytetrahydropterin synthase
MISVTKDFTFSYAHRLIKGYKGHCRFNHGHNAHVYITVDLYGDRTLNKFGFVEDFGKIKIVKKWVDENWDHAALVNSQDKSWLTWLKKNKQKRYEFYIGNGNPTVENMCKELLSVAQKLLNNDRVFVSKVTIFETDSSSATITDFDRR